MAGTMPDDGKVTTIVWLEPVPLLNSADHLPDVRKAAPVTFGYIEVLTG